MSAKSIFVGALIACSFATSGSAFSADISNGSAFEAQVRRYNCNACHRAEKKLVGPSWSDISARYSGSSVDLLVRTAQIGNLGATRWGPVHCGGDKTISEVDARNLISSLLGVTPQQTSTNAPYAPAPAKGNQPGSAALNCPDEVTIGHVAFKHLGQGRFLCGPSNPAYGGLSRCTDLEDTLSLEGSPRGLNEDERQRAVAWAKCHFAAHKGGPVSANAGAPALAKINQPASAASNCKKEINIKYPTDQFGNYFDITFRSLGGPDYDVTWRPSGQHDQSYLGKSLSELIEFGEADQASPDVNHEWRKVAGWARCLVASQTGNSVSTSSGTRGTQAQINVGGARGAVVGKGVSKNASSPKTQSECNQDAKSFIKKSGGNREIAIANLKKMVADARANKSGEISKLPKDEREEMLSFMDKEAADLINGMNSCTESDLASIKPKSKYVSKDATHCVEIVPKGFKCDGPYDRFLTNICMTKISVQWRLGSDPWGMQELAPKGCTPVSPFEDPRGVQFKACSWDPKANHGPYSDPCRY